MQEKRGRPILKRIVLILLIGLSAALQYNIARYIGVRGAYPNLMFVTAVTAGFTIRSEAGGFAGFSLGLYQDSQSGKILGMHALLFLYAGVISGLIPKKAGLGDLPALLIAVYALTVLYEGAIYLFAYAIPVLRNGYLPGADLLHAIGAIIVPTAFLNAVCSVPFYLVLRPGSAYNA